jgi:hypothetical protein
LNRYTPGREKTRQHAICMTTVRNDDQRVDSGPRHLSARLPRDCLDEQSVGGPYTVPVPRWAITAGMVGQRLTQRPTVLHGLLGSI